MTVVKTTATEMKNDFDRYLNIVMAGKEVIVTKNGREFGRFISKYVVISYVLCMIFANAICFSVAKIG